MTGKIPTDWDIFNCTLVHNLLVNGFLDGQTRLILWRERPHKREDDDRPTTDDDDDARSLARGSSSFVSCILLCFGEGTRTHKRDTTTTTTTTTKRSLEDRPRSSVVFNRGEDKDGSLARGFISFVSDAPREDLSRKIPLSSFDSC